MGEAGRQPHSADPAGHSEPRADAAPLPDPGGTDVSSRSGGRPRPGAPAAGEDVIATGATDSDVVVLRLAGTFDAAEAWRVHDALGDFPPGTRVSLDFREVRVFHDFAIALLARELLARHGRVTAVGLCQHQRRILKYFGVDESGLGEPCAAESTEPRPVREDAGDSLGL